MNAFSRLAMTLCIIALSSTACGPRDGARGERGEQGLSGLSGRDGESIVGPQGPAGENATSVTIVRFCPGTTVYPTKFVEVGFCVDNKIYGTYSTHGGFSTELPPGTYNSNAVGSSCNFEIKANCEVVSQ